MGAVAYRQFHYPARPNALRLPAAKCESVLHSGQPLRWEFSSFSRSQFFAPVLNHKAQIRVSIDML
jgi:hypothetical protein